MGGYTYKEIILNSADLTYGTLNSPVFQFDQIIDESHYFQVHRAIVPFSYYVFDADRTSITVNTITYNWAPGNYTASEWVAMMAAQLPATIICSWSSTTNKITFENTLNTPFNVSFNSAQLANEELGFPRGNTASVSTGPSHVVTSPFVVNFSGPNFLYLRSPQASIFNNTEMYFSKNNVDSLSGDILAMIPVDGNRFSVTNYVDQSANFFQWKTVGNKRFNFYFTLGNRTSPVDFNGQSFQLRLHGYSQLDEGPFRFNR